MYNNPEEFEPLTPSHFLVGRRLDSIPPVYNNLEGKNDLEERYKLLEEIKQKFWDQWSMEYLPELTYYAQSRKTNVGKIQVGDIVLIGSEKSRGKWRLGRVQSLRHGKDGKVRAAQVKTSGKKILNRPIQQLYPLETAHSTESSERVVPRALQETQNAVADQNDADIPDEVFTDAESTNVKKTRSGRLVKPSVVYSRDDFVYDVDKL